MKKTIIIAALTLSLTSCSYLLNPQGSNNNTGGTYTHDVTPPPTSGYNSHVTQQQGNGYQSGHVTQQQGNGYQSGHVTQQQGNGYQSSHVSQQQGNGYPSGHVAQHGAPSSQQNTHGNEARRPVTGDMVTSLPDRGVKTVTVGGETLYLHNGTYYKPVRTGSGIAYKVVGHQ